VWYAASGDQPAPIARPATPRPIVTSEPPPPVVAIEQPAPAPVEPEVAPVRRVVRRAPRVEPEQTVTPEAPREQAPEHRHDPLAPAEFGSIARDPQ
jgi:hypothetical protein